ncbi:MAG: sialidase family protein [Thermaerobacter sp.]|nr:sialidase family protein [Thermaerobacter sp.]
MRSTIDDTLNDLPNVLQREGFRADKVRILQSLGRKASRRPSSVWWAASAAAFLVAVVAIAAAMHQPANTHVGRTNPASKGKTHNTSPRTKTGIVGLNSAELNQYIGAGESGKLYPGSVLAASFQSGKSDWVVLGKAATPSSLVAYQSDDNGKTWGSTQIVIPGTDAASSLHMYAVSSKEAWILVGGMPAASQETWYLFHTVDGGARWTLQQGRGASFLYGDVSPVVTKFSATGTGWIVADSPVVTSATTVIVYRTMNGGKTWTSSRIQFQPYWGAVQLVGPTNVGSQQWKLTVVNKGSGGSNSTRVFTSTDNGATWH